MLPSPLLIHDYTFTGPVTPGTANFQSTADWYLGLNSITSVSAIQAALDADFGPGTYLAVDINFLPEGFEGFVPYGYLYQGYTMGRQGMTLPGGDPINSDVIGFAVIAVELATFTGHYVLLRDWSQAAEVTRNNTLGGPGSTHWQEAEIQWSMERLADGDSMRIRVRGKSLPGQAPLDVDVSCVANTSSFGTQVINDPVGVFFRFAKNTDITRDLPANASEVVDSSVSQIHVTYQQTSGGELVVGDHTFPIYQIASGDLTRNFTSYDILQP